MPYIKKEKRPQFEPHIDGVVDLLLNDQNDVAGNLNFFVSSIIKRYVAKKGESYRTYNELIGSLECIKIEAYRRLIEKYEDLKKDQNGDY